MLGQRSKIRKIHPMRDALEVIVQEAAANSEDRRELMQSEQAAVKSDDAYSPFPNYESRRLKRQLLITIAFRVS